MSRARNIPKEILDYVKNWAYDSYDCGHPMDSNDFDEFKKILLEDLEDNLETTYTLSEKDLEYLFDYYYEMFDEARAEDNW